MISFQAHRNAINLTDYWATKKNSLKLFSYRLPIAASETIQQH